MKNLSLVGAALFLIFLLLHLDVFELHDAQTFVPPPESVTQNFFKMLEMKRFSIARKFLNEKARQRIKEYDLQVLSTQILIQAGPYQVYGGDCQFLDQDHAASNAQLKGVSNQIWPVVKLQREKGEWKIQEIVAF